MALRPAPSPDSLRSAASRARALACLRRLVASLGQPARAVHPDSGLTNAQMLALQLLAESTELTINEVAARTRTKQSTASLLVARLVRAGLVSRHSSPDDGRRVYVRLTPHGRHTIRDAPEMAATVLSRGLATLSDRDVDAITRGMRALLLAMESAGDAMSATVVDDRD